MSSEQLPVVGTSDQLPVVAGDYKSKFADVPAIFDEIAGAGGFLPRIQFMSSKAKVVSDGLFPMNHFALIRGSNNVDLGQQVDVFVLSYRFKAIDLSSENMLISYDPKSEMFKDISARSFIQNSKCMFGPEFLMFIPSQNAFGTFFLGAKSARMESQSIMAVLKKPDATNWITLLPKKIDSKKYGSWWIGTGIQCQSEYDLPSSEECDRVVEQFDNPPTQMVEKAMEDDRER